MSMDLEWGQFIVLDEYNLHEEKDNFPTKKEVKEILEKESATTMHIILDLRKDIVRKFMFLFCYLSMDIFIK